MDTTNVNSGEKSRLKCLLKHAVPHLNWLGCGNHKLTLCFKHLLKEFTSVLEADVFLETLWKHFKYRSLAMNLLRNSAEMYGEAAIVPVVPSVT